MSKQLTLKQQATNYQTMQHILTVQAMMHLVVERLLSRALVHDQSKLISPEVEAFTEATPLLAKNEYGSPEYEAAKQKLGVALAHHYACNPHHPEHYKNGINGMTLIDLVEMLCDWFAATARNKNGDIHKSLEINTERFGIEPQLRQILENTINSTFRGVHVR